MYCSREIEENVQIMTFEKNVRALTCRIMGCRNIGSPIMSK